MRVLGSVRYIVLFLLLALGIGAVIAYYFLSDSNKDNLTTDIPVMKKKASSGTFNTQEVEKPMVYVGDSFRDPFEKEEIANTKTQKKLSPLMQYPLSNIKLVGIVEGEKGKEAYIRFPDEKVFKIQQGSIIGQEGALVQNINDDGVKLLVKSEVMEGESQTRFLTLGD